MDPNRTVCLSMLSVWNATRNCDQHQLDKAFRTVFMKAYDRLHKRGYRLSSSQCPDDNERNQSFHGPASPSAQPELEQLYILDRFSYFCTASSPFVFALIENTTFNNSSQ
nr:unnamed protein product [Spirometra erinaceieuropaei]